IKSPPAQIPQTFDAMLKHGTMISAAKYFGARTNSMGSNAMTRRASISSVTLMLPISAANADPERPLTAMAVKSGPSSPAQAAPGKVVDLTAAVAPNPRAAAEYYPAIYWFSLLRVPDKSEFPGTGPKGNGIPENMKSQGQWLHYLKTDSCWSCHQMGDKATHEIPKSLGHFDSSTAAWARRLLSGQAGNNMINGLGQLGPERALPMFADWTDRIAAGELPLTPPRPQGVERNVVITEWDWAGPKAYLHDEIATDKRSPTLNAKGAIYGAAELRDR